jgi:hypothetical protein
MAVGANRLRTKLCGGSPVLVGILILIMSVPALAWNDEGHMATAYVAYQRLSPRTRMRVDELLKLNPHYGGWLATIPAGTSDVDRDLRIFMIASTWADQIKGDPGYQDDGTNGGNTPGGPEASRNIGYADHLRHKYWHFIDMPFTQDGSALPAIPVPNAETQIIEFRKVLASSEPDELKSYDLVWIEHLVGDLHQPLHAVTRVISAHPMGDAGGNGVRVCADPCRDNLHAFWDDLVGGRSHLPEPIRPRALTFQRELESEVDSAMRAAKELSAPDENLAKTMNAAEWTRESFDLAKSAVYVPPIGSGAGPFVLTQDYLEASRRVAQQRVALAGARLANLLNAELK